MATTGNEGKKPEVEPPAPVAAAATEEVKLDLFEDDDEFEEFEIGLEKEENVDAKDLMPQWEDDWDDDDVDDDFSVQLRRELETNAEKK
ncbi:hypothetical protein AKJ16_DCAP20094 [Drosera capensis]